MTKKPMSNKKIVLDAVLTKCLDSGKLTFDNDLVKSVCKELNFGNAFDVTKLDNSQLLSPLMLQHDYCIIHVGGGKHQFIKGISTCYHAFEPIKDNSILTWNYRKSVLNELDTSESNILSVASNQRIIHDFLYQDIVASPKVYNARRTKLSFSYMYNESEVSLHNQQMEIDLTLEYQGMVTVIEGKNGFPSDFNVLQLYFPFRYYHAMKDSHNLSISDVTSCYILRKKTATGSILRLYNYKFTNIERLDSLQLLKSAEYRLIRR